MARVKIISNPYKKEIRYQQWIEEHENWEDIDYANHGNSELFNREYKNGFFPFKVKQIVDILVREYNEDGKILEIYFEGAPDEYEELVATCTLDTFKGTVSVSQSDIELANARDILPEVRNLFAEMSPLILQSASQYKIQRDLNRFSDASSDVVPICVLGNYSTGKSTFINALIGSEILASGNEAVTAKVYKISRSKFQDRAFIKCKYLGFDICIQFTDKESHFELGTTENALSKALKEALFEMENESLVERVRASLMIINDYEFDAEFPEVSDLIEVEIPFVNGVLADTLHPFVIFDTPGPNSATYARHKEVLKDAMANMTNGLPVFLSTASNLDTTDNENLYHIIREMDELDSRFTMIVVNRADEIGVQRKERTELEKKKILNQAIPRNLYSSGLFYVSSIIGLGSKIDGEFINEEYGDIYDAQHNRYKDANNKYYRTLYKNNIQPEQLNERANSIALEQQNLIYTNSGLFTIEKEIEEFAGKYSAYNKCSQSELFLSRVINITKDEIEEKKRDCEGIRQSIKDKLEIDKKGLINRLDEEAKAQSAIYVSNYAEYMEEYFTSAEAFSARDLQLKEAEYTTGYKSDLGLDEKTDEVKKSWQSLSNNFKGNVSNVFKERKLSAFKKIGQDLFADYENSKDSYLAQKDTKHQIDKQAADSLLKYVVSKYEEILAEAYEILNIKSKEYWSVRTKELQTVLARIVSGSDVLTESRRKELEQIIIMYPEIVFNEEAADVIFNKVNFERQFRIGNQVIWKSDHLKIEKLVDTYNSNILNGVNARYECIRDNHKESAYAWVQNLLDEIYENIVEYSPELSKQAKQIRMMTEQIEELENRQLRLQGYTDQLVQMMDWKKMD